MSRPESPAEQQRLALSKTGANVRQTPRAPNGGQTTSHGHSPGRAAARILVVDDNEAGRYALAQCLRRAGHHVKEASTGQECLRLVADGDTDVLLLDVKLPDISGIEICKQLKSNPATAGLPVIQISALLTGTDERVLGLESGADAYLIAPFEPRELLAHVTGLMRVRRAEDLLRQDIARRQEAERALQESQELLSAIYGGLEAAITVSEVLDDGQAFRFVSANRACIEWTGIPLERWIGKLPQDLLSPADAAAICEHYRNALREGKSISYEEYLRFPNGARWALTTVAPLRDAEGRIRRVVATSVDISEQKRVEQALRESEERFRSLANGTPVLIWVHGPDAGLRFVNRAWREFFGVTLEQATGGNWKPLLHPDDAQTYVETFLKCHADRRQFAAQVRARRHDGHWRWIESVAVPRFSAAGEFLGMAGSSVDITDRKEAEAVLARDRAELEELVTERTAKLQELVGELEHFSYSITHDMRAPLRAMMGFASVVEELWRDREYEEVPPFLRRIQTSARRMDLLITDALSYSRAVRSDLPLAPVDPEHLLRGMLDTYPELQNARQSITLANRLPLVMANEAGLTQCFSNLLGNAVRFVPPDRPPEIRVRAEPRDGWVRLWVEDNGVGISPGMLPRVFDMFVRGSSEQAGTGVGLALVRKVVQRMGGRVGVESTQGKGSRFWIELKSGNVRQAPAVPDGPNGRGTADPS